VDLRRRPYAIRLVITTAVYALSIGVTALISHGLIPVPVWLPAGVALACVYFMGQGVAPAVFSVTIVSTLVAGWPGPLSIAAAIVLTAEAALGAWLLAARTDYDPTMGRVRDCVLLLVLGAAAASLPSLVIGALALAYGLGSAGGPVASVGGWWISTAVGVLAAAPPLMLLSDRIGVRGPTLGRAAGWVAFVVLVTGVLAILPFSPLEAATPVVRSFLVFPFLVFVAMRGRQHGAALGTVVIALGATWATTAHMGLFATQVPMAGYLPLQLFLVIAGTTTLVIGSTMAERDSAQRSVLAAEGKYRELVESIPAVTYEAGTARPGPAEYVSPQIEQVLGYTPQEWRDTSGAWLGLVHPDDRAAVETAMAGLSDGDTLDIQYRIRDKRGRYHWVADRAVRSVAPDGLGLLSGTLSDITEMREAEEALDESEAKLRETDARYRAIVEHSGDAISRLSLDGRVLYSNPAAATLVGRSVEDALDRNISELARLFDDPRRVTAALRRVASTGVAVELEHHFDSAAGELFMSSMIIPELDQDGAVTSILVVSRDLTKRRAAELAMTEQREALEVVVLERTRALSDANERLRELDKLKSMFIASMSHELRTPLNSIIGFSGVLLSGLPGKINSEQRTQLEMVRGAGRHLLEVIGDILDLSQIEAGSLSPQYEEFDLADLEGEALNLVHAEAEHRGLTVVEDRTHVHMVTDRRRLLQCVVNLLSNAVKYTQTGTVGLEVKQLDGEVSISVEDTGIGIAERDKSRIFSPFTRLDSPMRASTPGTGLGLYVTRKVANEVLGGDVAFESRLGRGSRFTLTVPAELEDDAGARTPSERD
jgi:PAS domain S-box-containing protein